MKDEFYVMRTPEQREGLQDMIVWINNIKPTSEMRMIEIGSYVGESTLMFAKHFKEVVSIDPYINDYDLDDDACHHAPFDKVYEQFIRNTLSVPNIKSIKETSQNAFSILKGGLFSSFKLPHCVKLTIIAIIDKSFILFNFLYLINK